MDRTKGDQVPWTEDGIQRRQRVLFGGKDTRPSEATEAWGAAKDSTSTTVLEGFIARYKNTFYAGLARERIEELKVKQAAEAKRRVEQAARDFEEGDRYLYGRGVPRDYAKAREMLEKAAAGGNGASMNALGRLYRDGLGGRRDYGKAREWFERGSTVADSHSMINYADLYREGLGVQRDYDKAREWSEKAIAAGNAGGTNMLGLLYESGQGVPKDLVKARELFEKAAAAGQDFSNEQPWKALPRWHGGRAAGLRQSARVVRKVRRSG